MSVIQVAVICATVALAMAAPGGHHGGSSSHIYRDQDHYGGYNFGYGIHDHHTYDNHGRNEYGHGYGQVAGSYYLHDPNGYVRSVKYYDDGYSGTHQAVYGSEHGLYVHSPYFSITPSHHGGHHDGGHH